MNFPRLDDRSTETTTDWAHTEAGFREMQISTKSGNPAGWWRLGHWWAGGGKSSGAAGLLAEGRGLWGAEVESSGADGVLGELVASRLFYLLALLGGQPLVRQGHHLCKGLVLDL